MSLLCTLFTEIPGTRAEGLSMAVMCFATMAVTLILQEMCLHQFIIMLSLVHAPFTT
jgi:hypothetical protein